MNDEVILKDDEVIRYLILWALRSGHQIDTRSFELGRMSVALMLESQARIFEAFEGTSLVSLNKIEVAVALRTLLRTLKIDDDALDVYESVTVMKEADHPTFRGVVDHRQLETSTSDYPTQLEHDRDSSLMHASPPPTEPRTSEPVESGQEGMPASSPSEGVWPGWRFPTSEAMVRRVFGEDIHLEPQTGVPEILDESERSQE